jgi:hypothetical protein
VLVLALPLAVFADQVVNNIDSTIDPALETKTITAGGSGTVGFYIQASTTIPAGDANGCNATGANPATVNLSVPAGVTASSTSLTFTGCGIVQNVTFSSSTVGNHTISVANVTGGKLGSLWDTAPAAFTLVVNPPSDTTPPVITPNVSGTLGDNGWYVSDVSVSWTVTDPESAITSKVGCNPTTINTDTSGTTLTCSATSAGGTSSQSVTIKRDATPPTISGVAAPAPNAAGWNNTDVTVSFTCGDSMSGVASCGPDQTLSGEGSGQSATGTAVDNAGNSASTTVSGINIDKTPPILSGSRAPLANANGWNSTDVTVSFSCSDTLSGVDTAPLSPQVVSSEGTGQSRSATCTDTAGNSASATVGGINIDKTAPTASASASPGPNANGWNNTDVTMSFSGADALSGVDFCSAPVTLSSEGAGQSASGTCTDRASNVSAPATASGINIDKTPPTFGACPAGGPFLLNSGLHSVGPIAVDATISGLNAGLSTLSGSVDTSSVGTKSVTFTAVDNASNTVTTNCSYSVIYNWNGFFRPVDNLPTLNVAKAGSAIPVKFSLSGNQGLSIFTAGYPQSQKIVCETTAPADGIEETVTAGGSSLSYDVSVDQYVYVWKTDKAWAGTCRQLVVKLNDGTERRANFKFSK